MCCLYEIQTLVYAIQIDKGTSLSYHGHKFSSYNPQDSSQPSVIIVPWDPMPSSGIQGQEPQMYREDTYTHRINIKTSF